MDEVGTKVASNSDRSETGNLKDIIHSAIDRATERHASGSTVEEPRAKREKASETRADESKPNSGMEPKGQPAQGEVPDRSPKADTDVRTPAEQTTQTESDQDTPFAPKSWTEAERNAFSQAPKEVQQAIDKLVKNLQAGFTKKTMSLAENARLADEVKSAFQPHHRAEMQRHGLTEAAVVKEFVKLQDQFMRDPVGYVKMVMNARGITPQHLGFGQPTQDAALATSVDPSSGQTTSQQAQLQPEVVQMQRELAAMRGVLENAANSSAQQKIVHAANLIQTFAHEVDGAGNPVRPYFETLQPNILHILEHDPDVSQMKYGPEKLQAAYDRAAWLNPSVRAELLTGEKERERQAWETERARKAVSVKPRSGGAAQKSKGRATLEQSINEAMSKHGM